MLLHIKQLHRPNVSELQRTNANFYRCVWLSYISLLLVLAYDSRMLALVRSWKCRRWFIVLLKTGPGNGQRHCVCDTHINIPSKTLNNTCGFFRYGLSSRRWALFNPGCLRWDTKRKRGITCTRASIKENKISCGSLYFICGALWAPHILWRDSEFGVLL